MSFFTRPDSPPPRIPSPPLVPTSLPSPRPRSTSKRSIHSVRSYDRIRDTRPLSTTHSLPISFKSTSRRLSVAVPYLSPPPSPTIASPPPPVPTIPAFALTPTDKIPVLHRWPTPIYVPELDISPPTPSKKTRSPSTPSREDNAMTCSKFLSLRNSSHKAAARTAAV